MAVSVKPGNAQSCWHMHTLTCTHVTNPSPPPSPQFCQAENPLKKSNARLVSLSLCNWLGPSVAVAVLHCLDPLSVPKLFGRPAA